DDDKEVLLGHLEGCDACAQKLNTLPESDTLVDLIRQAQTLSGDTCRRTIAELVERLSKLRPAAGPSPVQTSSVAVRLFACPSCRQTLTVRNELAGQPVKCPHCKSPLRIPTT